MEAVKTSSSFTKWKPIEWMLALLFLAAPFYYHPNIGGEGLRIPNNITAWMVATVIIGYSLQLVLKRPTFVIPKYFIYIASFPILITFSGFVVGVEQPLKWLFRLLFIWGGLAFFFSLFQHKLKQGRLDRILFVVVISALLQGMVGIAQIWLQADMPFWLPKSPNGVPSGLFQQINNMATYQVTAIMIAGYLTVRPFVVNGKLWLKTILILSIAVASFIVMESGSRIGVLSLVLGLLIMIPAQWKRIKRYKKMASIALLSLLVGLGAGGKTIDSNSNVVDKTVAMQSGYSGSARLGVFSISLDLIKEKPIFGYGIGNFDRVWQYGKPDFYKSHPDAVLPEKYVTHPHNETLFWLVEGGVIAAVGLLLVLTAVLLAFKQIGWQKSGVHAAILLPIALHTQVELPLYSSALHWFVFIFLLTLVGGTGNHITKKQSLTIAAKRLLVIFLTFFIGISFVFFAHTLRSQQDFTEFYQKLNLDKPAFPYALKNPYLGEEADWLKMSEFLILSINAGLHSNVEQFTVWGQQRLIIKPTVELYVKLLDAYTFLDNKEAYCVIAGKGVVMYPRAEQLKLAQDFCQH